MKRRRFSACAGFLFLIGAAPSPVAAYPVVVDLVWTDAVGSNVEGLGTSEVRISPNSVTQLTLDIQLRLALDELGFMGELGYVYVPKLVAAGLSLEFDRAGNDVLNVLSFQVMSWSGTGLGHLDLTSPQILAGKRGECYG